MKTDALNDARILLASLPLFAQGLAGPAGVTVVISGGATTASTNGEQVTLPALPLPTDPADAETAKRLAMLSSGFIAHECGHVRFTDFAYLRSMKDVLSDTLTKSLWNAIEDPWQEAAFIRRFRGARLQLDEMTEALIGHPNFYSVLTTEMSPMWLVSAYCLYLLRGDIREQKPFQELAEKSRPALVQIFGAGFVTRLEVLMDVHGPKLDSTEKALDLALRVKGAMEEEKERQEQEQQQEQQKPNDAEDGSSEDDGSSSDGEDESGDQGGDSQSTDEDGQGGDDSSGDDSGDGKGGKPDAGDGSKQDGAGGDHAANGAGGGSGDPDVIKQALQDALDGNGDMVEDLSDGVAREISQNVKDIERNGHTGHVKDDPNAIVRDPGKVPPRKPYQQGVFDPMASMAQSGRLRALMANELQSLQLLREHEAPRGAVLNERRIHRSSSGDRRLFLQTDDRKKLNTAVFFLADVSGSMGDEPIKLEAEALYASAVALNGLTGVSTAIGTFPGYGMVLNFGEQAMRVPERFALGATGSTPMAEGVLWASRLLMQRREERKILIVTTDGAPDCHTTAVAQIAAAKLMGIEVMGLGIRLPMVETLFEKSAVIQSIDEISGAMLSMVRGALRAQLQAA